MSEESSFPPPSRPALPDEEAGTAIPGYTEYVAERLEAQVAELSREWLRRGAEAIAAPERDRRVADVEGADGRAAEEILRVVAAAAARGIKWQERVMRAGWGAGTAAFWRSASLHQLLKELDAGIALLLRAAHAATFDYPGQASALDGLGLARRLNDAASLLRLAAAGGYTRVMADDLRSRYRTIRHDLRNPLGTITSAVAMMEDETLPEATRQNPRVRAMVARNARSMDAMISAALGDSAARLPALALQSTTLRDVACAVRGDLRASVDRVDVAVGEALPTFPIEVAGLELMLKALVLEVARHAEERAEIVIDLAELGPRTATLAIFSSGERREGAEALDLTFARDLVTRLGGRVSSGPGLSVLIEIPMEPIAARESSRDSGNDVAREGERADGEPRLL